MKPLKLINNSENKQEFIDCRRIKELSIKIDW